jgi:hypothetical protein
VSVAKRSGSTTRRGAAGAPESPAASDPAAREATGDATGEAREATGEASRDALVHRHLAWGWWSLAGFTALGLVLEAAHGLKAGWYLDITAGTRRLSFTLGHAHGTLLGLVNIAFALSLARIRLSAVALARASFALRAATVLMPVGFLLGGVAVYAGDPGFAIALVPPGGALLVIALVIVARGVPPRR